MSNSNNPSEFDELEVEKQETLLKWIQENFISAPILYNEYNSNDFRQLVEQELALYVSNGAIKGAFVKAGIRPRKKSNEEINWLFYMKKKRIGDLRE